MENSYTRWLELQEEKADQEKEEFTDLNKFAKKITQVVETADSFYDAYEGVEKLLKKFVELQKEENK
jgi:peptide methionine sulfoxide reductase MsrA